MINRRIYPPSGALLHLIIHLLLVGRGGTSVADRTAAGIIPASSEAAAGIIPSLDQASSEAAAGIIPLWHFFLLGRLHQLWWKQMNLRRTW